MYYYEDIIADIEELIMDFLMYRQSKREQEGQMNKGYKNTVFGASEAPERLSIPLLSHIDNDMLITDMFADAMLPLPLDNFDDYEMDNEMNGGMNNGYDYGIGNGTNNGVNNGNNGMGSGMGNGNQNMNPNMPSTPNQNANRLPGQNGNQNGGQLPGQNGNQNAGQLPSQNGNQNGGQLPGQNGNQTGGQLPGQNGNQNAGQLPGQNGNQMPGQNASDREMEYIKQIYTEINKKLYPYVQEVLREYMYEGSPVYDDYIDKETLAEIVDKVIERAKSTVNEVNDITATDASNRWSVYRMLRAIVESLALFQIFALRRRRYL